MPEPGDYVAGYRLETELGRKGFYIHTWRAADEHGSPVVIKLHHLLVSDDDGAVHDLTEETLRLLPEIERLFSTPAMQGMAPWRRRHFNAEEKYLLLCRSYYPDCPGERIPIPSGDRFLGMMKAAAGAIDFLDRRGVEPASLVPGNILADGGRAFLADYGLGALHRLIEHGYAGPRSCGGGLADFILRLNMDDREQTTAQKFATLYYYLRTGKIVFGNIVPGAESSLCEGIFKYGEAVSRYKLTGELDVEGLSGRGEREAVTRAFTHEAGGGLSSCSQFVTSVARGLEGAGATLPEGGDS